VTSTAMALSSGVCADAPVAPPRYRSHRRRSQRRRDPCRCERCLAREHGPSKSVESRRQAGDDPDLTAKVVPEIQSGVGSRCSSHSLSLLLDPACCPPRQARRGDDFHPATALDRIEADFGRLGARFHCGNDRRADVRGEIPIEVGLRLPFLDEPEGVRGPCVGPRLAACLTS
jgi:hypothetical protein